MFVHLQNRSVLRRTVRYAHSRYPCQSGVLQRPERLGTPSTFSSRRGGGGGGVWDTKYSLHARGGVWDTKYILFTPGGVYGTPSTFSSRQGVCMGYQVHSLHARGGVWDTKYILFTPGGCMGHQVHSLHARGGVYGTPSTFSSRQGGVWDTKYILFTPGGCMGHQVHSLHARGCMGHQVHSLHAGGGGVYGTPSTFSSRQGGGVGHQVHSLHARGVYGTERPTHSPFSLFFFFSFLSLTVPRQPEKNSPSFSDFQLPESLAVLHCVFHPAPSPFPSWAGGQSGVSVSRSNVPMRTDVAALALSVNTAFDTACLHTRVSVLNCQTLSL